MWLASGALLQLIRVGTTGGLSALLSLLSLFLLSDGVGLFLRTSWSLWDFFHGAYQLRLAAAVPMLCNRDGPEVKGGGELKGHDAATKATGISNNSIIQIHIYTERKRWRERERERHTYHTPYISASFLWLYIRCPCAHICCCWCFGHNACCKRELERDGRSCTPRIVRKES